MDDIGLRVAIGILGAALVYAAIAYLVMPALWRRYTRRHPLFTDVPGVSHTATGIPGDPLNVALIATPTELAVLMDLAGWSAADPLSLRSDLRIVIDTVRKRPYGDAPVSSLFMWGRKEDLAFEQQMDGNPRERHHVRLWQLPTGAADGRPVWIGSATFDVRVGFSDRTGQVTHHIAEDVDAERDYLIRTLTGTRRLAEVYPVAAFHKVHAGRNGGGDPWRTDGALKVAVVAPDAKPQPSAS